MLKPPFRQSAPNAITSCRKANTLRVANVSTLPKQGTGHRVITSHPAATQRSPYGLKARRRPPKLNTVSKLRKLLSRANIPQLDGTLKQRRCHPRRFMRTHQMPYGGSLHLVVSGFAHLLIGVDTHLLTAYAQERSREVLLPPASAPQVRRKPSFTHLLMRPSAAKTPIDTQHLCGIKVLLE